VQLAQDYPKYKDAKARARRLQKWEDAYQAGLSSWDAHRWNDSLQQFESLAVACPAYKNVETRIGTLRIAAKAQEAMASLQWEDAIQQLRRIAQVDQPFQQVFLQDQLESLSQAWMDAQRWDDARSLLLHLLPLLSQTSGTLVTRRDCLERWEAWYVTGSEAWSENAWDQALVSFTRLLDEEPHYKDARQKLETLQRCQEALQNGLAYLDDRLRLVGTAGWRDANEAFELVQALIPGYGDAGVALQYLGSLKAIHERRWEDAERLLAEIARVKPGFRDAQELQAGLQQRTILARLAASGSLEPALAWPGGYPYQVLDNAGLHLTPKSSLTDVREAAWSLQQTGMSPIQRQAWDDLRNVERRLFVDAFLLPLENGSEILTFVQDHLVDELNYPASHTLVARFPEQAPVVEALQGDFAAACAAGLAIQRRNPQSTGLAHQNALLSLFWAEQADAAEPGDNAAIAWQRVIGEWAILLSDQHYWQSWAEGHGRDYGQAVLASQVDDLLAQLEESLVRRLNEAELRRRPSKRRPQPDDAPGLPWEWRAEIAAVRLLRRLDGLPTRDHGRVACGLRLLEPLELTSALGSHFARLSEEPSTMAAQLAGAPSDEEVRRLRQYFSSLSLAAAFLESTQPEPAQALEILTHADCGSCPPCYDPFCPLHAVPTPNVRVCCGNCHNFARRNPAYAHISRDCGGWLHEDAEHLAKEAFLRQAQELVTREQEWDLAGVRRCWDEALRLAKELGEHDQVVQQVRTAAMGRAAVLGRDPALHTDSTRLDHAAALLETAATLVPITPQMQLRLGDVLTDRASFYLKRDAHEQAVEDFERAYAIVAELEQKKMFVPYRHRTQDLFATALTWRAMDLAEHDRDRARAMLDQAQGLAEGGLELKPDYDEYRKTLDLLANARAMVEGSVPPALQGDPWEALDSVLAGRSPGAANSARVLNLRAAAEEQRQGGDLAGSLNTLAQAWALERDDQGVQEDLVDTVIKLAIQLLAAGQGEQQQHLVDDWADRLATASWVAERADALRWMPRIQHLLEQTDLKWREAGPYLTFPFDSPIVGTVILRLFIQGEAICVAGPLPPMSEADEAAVYSSLLQNTADLMLIRAGLLERIGPTLMAYLPARYLDAAWLEFLLRGMARYADMQPSFLRNPIQLRVHLRSQREILRLLQPDRGRPQRTMLDLPQLSQTLANCSCRELDDGSWRIEAPIGVISATATDEGVRLVHELGALGAATSFKAIAAKNSHLGLGKVSLDDRGRAWLICELPYLDHVGLQAILTFFAEQAPRIRQEIGSSR
jgi:hypothetical protein